MIQNNNVSIHFKYSVNITNQNDMYDPNDKSSSQLSLTNEV